MEIAAAAPGGGAGSQSLLLDPQGLREALMLSRCRLDEWVEHRKEQIDVLAESQRVELMQRQRSVDRAVADLLALQLEGGLTIGGGGTAAAATNNEENTDKENTTSTLQQNASNSKRDEIAKEQTKAKEEIDRLQKELDEKESIVKELGLDAMHERELAAEAQEWRDRVKASKAAAIRYLTRSVNHYRQIGLTFRKEEGGEEQQDGSADGSLRFTFTQLDPNDPTRAFAFGLRCDDDSYYLLTPLPSNNNNNAGKEPDGTSADDVSRIPPNVLEDLMRTLNRTDELSEFVRGIRKAFIESL